MSDVSTAPAEARVPRPPSEPPRAPRGGTRAGVAAVRVIRPTRDADGGGGAAATAQTPVPAQLMAAYEATLQSFAERGGGGGVGGGAAPDGLGVRDLAVGVASGKRARNQKDLLAPPKRPFPRSMTDGRDYDDIREELLITKNQLNMLQQEKRIWQAKLAAMDRHVGTVEKRFQDQLVASSIMQVARTRSLEDAMPIVDDKIVVNLRKALSFTEDRLKEKVAELDKLKKSTRFKTLQKYQEELNRMCMEASCGTGDMDNLMSFDDALYELRTKLDNSLANNKELEAEIAGLQESVESLEKDYADALDRERSLTRDKEELEDETEKLRRHVSDVTATLDACKKTIFDDEAEIAKQNKEISRMESTLSGRENQIESLKKDILELDEARLKETGQLHTEIDGLKYQKSQLEEHRDRMDVKNKLLGEECSNLHQSLQRDRQVNAELEQQLMLAQQHVAKNYQNIHSLEQELTAAQDRAHHLEAELDGSYVKQDGLRAELARAYAARMEAEDAGAKLRLRGLELDNEVALQKRKNEMLEAHVAALQAIAMRLPEPRDAPRDTQTIAQPATVLAPREIVPIVTGGDSGAERDGGRSQMDVGSCAPTSESTSAKPQRHELSILGFSSDDLIPIVDDASSFMQPPPSFLSLSTDEINPESSASNAGGHDEAHPSREQVMEPHPEEPINNYSRASSTSLSGSRKSVRLASEAALGAQSAEVVSVDQQLLESLVAEVDHLASENIETRGAEANSLRSSSHSLEPAHSLRSSAHSLEPAPNHQPPEPEQKSDSKSFDSRDAHETHMDDQPALPVPINGNQSATTEDHVTPSDFAGREVPTSIQHLSSVNDSVPLSLRAISPDDEKIHRGIGPEPFQGPYVDEEVIHLQEAAGLKIRQPLEIQNAKALFDQVPNCIEYPPSRQRSFYEVAPWQQTAERARVKWRKQTDVNDDTAAVNDVSPVDEPDEYPTRNVEVSQMGASRGPNGLAGVYSGVDVTADAIAETHVNDFDYLSGGIEDGPQDYDIKDIENDGSSFVEAGYLPADPDGIEVPDSQAERFQENYSGDQQSLVHSAQSSAASHEMPGSSRRQSENGAAAGAAPSAAFDGGADLEHPAPRRTKPAYPAGDAPASVRGHADEGGLQQEREEDEDAAYEDGPGSAGSQDGGGWDEDVMSVESGSTNPPEEGQEFW
ncbi:hypothetical protein HK405_002549 [Cladochytrium tenue]|nr:hypothetical protein HK405_002549 [Cladochytrium tenue]